MKKIIIPAILEKKKSKIEEKIKRAEKTKIKLIQIDICDGILTPSKTFASNFRIDSLKKIKDMFKKINVEIDLIADLRNDSRIKKYLKGLIFLNPSRVVFHFSGIKNWNLVFQELKKKKIKIGLGIWLNDENKKIEELLEKYSFNYIQIMGIEKVGFGGQKLSDKIFKKIRYFSKKYPELFIQIDGGVKLNNSKKLSTAGVSGFVSGSGFYGAKKLKERLKEFQKEIL